MKDYVAAARQYEADVRDGVVPACRWVRLACARNRHDLDRVGVDPTFPFEFNTARATAICQTAELFPHIKGPKAKVVSQDDEGRALWATIELEPWQCWLLTTVFGWIHPNGRRRFKVALVLVPRKNAKSTIGAVLINYMVTADGEAGAEVYSAATTRDQAKVSAEIAWEMARRSHQYRDYFGVRIGAKTTRTLEVPATASKFAPLSADAHSLDGLNVSCALIDELHAHKTRAVWDVLDTATGTRVQPLLFAITTAGSDIHGVCYEKLLYLHSLLEGVHHDDEFFGVNYTVDEGDDWTDPVTWRKANPNYAVSVQPEDLARKAREANQSPQARNNFLTKHLNVWVTSSAPCLSVDGWRAGQSSGWKPAFEIPELRGEPCFVGVDIAKKIDLCSVTFAFPPAPGRPTWRWLQQIWTPRDTMAERSIRDRVSYTTWAEQGWLIAHPGTRVDLRVVVDAILAGSEYYDLQCIGFDPWHSDNLESVLINDHGFSESEIVEIPQTYGGMSSACLTVQAEVLAGDIDAGGCPVTAWSVGNVVANYDGKENLMFAKGKSTGRIDPVISGTIARALHLRLSQEPVSDPQLFFLPGRA